MKLNLMSKIAQQDTNPRKGFRVVPSLTALRVGHFRDMTLEVSAPGANTQCGGSMFVSVRCE